MHYLRFWFTSEGKIKHDIKGWISADPAVMCSLHPCVTLKKQLSRKAKLLFYRLIYFPILIYVLEL